MLMLQQFLKSIQQYVYHRIDCFPEDDKKKGKQRENILLGNQGFLKVD
jgi:hypothetical protein